MPNEEKSAMTRFFVAAMAAAVLGCGSAAAQVGAISPGSSPLGMTSPLGIGPGSPVAPTGIPMGATGLTTLGVSPTTSGTSPIGLTASSTTCSGIGGATSSMGTSMTGTSIGTGMSTFDG